MTLSPSTEAQCLADLKQENRTLAQQVKSLVRAESKLYEYQEKLDAQLSEYKNLYELNRAIGATFDLEEIFVASTAYVIHHLEYERVLFLCRDEQIENFQACVLDGYYDPEEQAKVKALVLDPQDEALRGLLEGDESLICTADSEDSAQLRERLHMQEYLLYPLGKAGAPHALIAVGNSLENAEFYRRISTDRDALLGMGNLVGLLSSRVENSLLYSSMEKALEQEKRAEAKYRGIFENAAEGIAQISPKGRILSCNPAAANILGYDSPAELLASISHIGRLLADQPELREQLFRLFYQGESVTDLDLEFLRKDGDRHWVQLSVRPVHNAQGKILYTDTLILDVAERKKAQQALLEANEKLEQRVISRTSELEKANVELRQVAGELEETITELKQAQSRILQQEKMASIGQLAAGVAHEINNPMGFIISNLNSFGKYAEKIKTALKQQSDTLDTLAADAANAEAIAPLRQQQKQLKVDYILEDLDDLIAESMDGAQRVKQIVQNLKSFSRVDESKCTPAHINEGLESTINMVWNEIKYKATLDRDFGELPATYCNLSQLNQVFMNLLVNAAQAIEVEGKIKVKTWSDETTIYVRIADNGCGIPPDKLNRIFEPFFTTKDVGKGTGLGLSIAYDIVKTHHGEMQVESTLGEGTTFTVCLPISTEPAPE